VKKYGFFCFSYHNLAKFYMILANLKKGVDKPIFFSYNEGNQ